jgi:hypothetical protein
MALRAIVLIRARFCAVRFLVVRGEIWPELAKYACIYVERATGIEPV